MKGRNPLVERRATRRPRCLQLRLGDEVGFPLPPELRSGLGRRTALVSHRSPPKGTTAGACLRAPVAIVRMQAFRGQPCQSRLEVTKGDEKLAVQVAKKLHVRCRLRLWKHDCALKPPDWRKSTTTVTWSKRQVGGRLARRCPRPRETPCRGARRARACRLRPRTDRDGDSHHHANRNADRCALGDAHAGADTDAAPNADTAPSAHVDADNHAFSDRDAGHDTHGDTYGDRHTDTHAGAHGHPAADLPTHADTDGTTDSNATALCHTVADPNSISYTNPGPNGHAHTTTQAHLHAAAGTSDNRRAGSSDCGLTVDATSTRIRRGSAPPCHAHPGSIRGHATAL